MQEEEPYGCGVAGCGLHMPIALPLRAGGPAPGACKICPYASLVSSRKKQHALSPHVPYGFSARLSPISLSASPPRIASANPIPVHPRSRIRPVGDPHPHAPALANASAVRALAIHTHAKYSGFMEQHGACLQSQTRTGVVSARALRDRAATGGPPRTHLLLREHARGTPDLAARSEIPSTARLNPPAKLRAASAVPRSAIDSIAPPPRVDPHCRPSWLWSHFPGRPPRSPRPPRPPLPPLRAHSRLSESAHMPRWSARHPSESISWRSHAAPGRVRPPRLVV